MNYIENDFEENEVFVKVSNILKKEATVDLFNAIRARNVKWVERAIAEGADVHAQRHFEQNNKTGGVLDYLLVYGVIQREQKDKEADLNKQNGVLNTIFELLINNGVNPLAFESTYEHLKGYDDTYIGRKFIEVGLNAINENVDNNSINIAEWIKNAIIHQRVEVIDKIQDKFKDKMNITFLTDETESSMLSYAIDTRNMEIITKLLSNVNENNVNKSISLVEHYSLLSETLHSVGNDSESKIPFYKFVAKDLLQKGAVLDSKQNFGAFGEKFLLEIESESNERELKNSSPKI